MQATAQRDEPLPVIRVAEIASQDRPQRWLVEQLWGSLVGRPDRRAPKCSKTWLGLDLALSGATGTACLGRYAVPEPGPVLAYLAEDALPIVRQRVEGMARHRGLDLDRVEIHVRKLRDALSVKNEQPGEALATLEQSSQLRRTAAGWQRID